MDWSKIFHFLNIIVIGAAVLILGRVFLLMTGMSSLVEDLGGDQLESGKMSWLVMMICLPQIVTGIIAILCGVAGLKSDPDRCKKLSRVLAAFAILSMVSAIREHSFTAMLGIEVVFFCVYAYLAHTQFY